MAGRWAKRLTRNPAHAVATSSAAANGNLASALCSIVVCTPQADKGRAHKLTDRLLIGRGAECDVVLDDGYSSHQHAVLYKRGGQHLLEDLSSANGTYINRERIRATAVLHLGDQIQIGTTVFEVVAAAAGNSAGNSTGNSAGNS